MALPLFEFDFNGSSPMILRDATGRVLFDAGVPPMRITQSGLVALPARSFSSGVGGTDAFVFIPYAKTYPASPYALFAQGINVGLPTEVWYAPFMWTIDYKSGSNPGPSYSAGAFFNSSTDKAAAGNMFSTNCFISYLVFDNTVDG